MVREQDTISRPDRGSSSAPDRIVFVLEFFYPHVGGLETLFQQLAEGLAHAGYRVSVITLHLPGTRLHEHHNGVEIVRVRTPPFAQRYWFMLLALPAALRSARTATLLHTTTYNAALPAWLASTIRRRPAVITVHEVFGEQWQTLPQLNPLLGYAFRFVEWSILHLPFKHFVCDSDFTARRLQHQMNVPMGKISTVYPAVDYTFWDRSRHTPRDLHRQLHLDPAAPIYLYFGRVGLSKGVEFLIDAAKIVRERAPQSRGVLLLARDPQAPYRQIIRRIAANGLGAHLHVLDPVPRAELPSYLLAASCVVVPSISEGFGYAAIEAATIGCPVITTTGHSVEEVLGESATFVAPRSAPALADAILRAFAARPPWREPRRFDATSHVAGIARIYAGLTDSTEGQQAGDNGGEDYDAR